MPHFVPRSTLRSEPPAAPAAPRTRPGPLEWILHFARGAVLLAAAAGLIACGGENGGEGTDGAPGGPNVGGTGGAGSAGSVSTGSGAAAADTKRTLTNAASVQHQVEVRFAYESPDGFSRPDAGRAARPNVLLITLDTTRRDRLSLHGYGLGTTPNLAALAAESVVFDRAFASAPTTLPSHATILTGIEPFEHGVRNNGIHALAPEFETVAETVRDLGYATGAILGAFPVASQFGLDQGFDHYDDDFGAAAAGTPVPQRSAEEVTRRGLEWMRAQSDRPWFCWLHYFDPHDPYAAPEPYRSLFTHPYDGELAYMDAHLGGLVRELKRQGLWKHTLVVITADHGEGLGDHNEPTHSLFVYNTTVAVPLLVRFPPVGAWEAASFRGRRIDALAATSDIAPTILDVLGGSFAPGVSYPGASLVTAVVHGRVVREVAYMETLVPELDYGWSPYRAVVAEDHKLILAPTSELYDLTRDPAEQVNLHGREPERVERLFRFLADRMERDHSAENLALDPATIEKLRSLGYVAGGGASSTGPLPDAKDMLWALDAFDQTRAHVLERDPTQASARLDQVLARDPGNRFARRMQSWLLLQLGEGQRAEELARTILREEPDAADRAVTEQRLAEAVLVRGDTGRAVEMIEQILADDPRSIESWVLAIRARAAKGDLAGARVAYEEALRLEPKRLEPVLAYGGALESAKQWAEAKAVYEKATEVHGNQVDILAGLASVDLHEGRAQQAADRAQLIVRADPGHPKGNYLLGACLILSGQPGQATGPFVRAVTSEPGNPEYHARLGNHLLTGQNYAKASEHLQRAIALRKEDAATLAALAMAQAALGDVQPARSNFRKALEKRPGPELEARIQEQLRALPTN